MNNIILIGMPGTGKSTVGVILAKHLGYDFLDCDILIARRAGRTLPEILEQDGMERFLELEGQVGESVHCERTVIATGGSMVFSPRAMEHLKKGSITVWMDTALSTLEKRLTAVSRHSRGVAAPEDMSIRDIYAQRAPLYRKYADLRLRCPLGTDGTVRKLEELLSREGAIRP